MNGAVPQIKILDFGLSRFEDSTSYSNGEGGHVRWKSPELIRMTELILTAIRKKEPPPICRRTKASDIYAFAMTLIEACIHASMSVIANA